MSRTLRRVLLLLDIDEAYTEGALSDGVRLFRVDILLMHSYFDWGLNNWSGHT